MGRIVITEFVSLDGVIESPGGGEGFKYDGWSFEIDRGDEGNAFKLEETMASEALLLGRTTYEGFAAAWPERDGEFADKFNTMPKFVLSSTLENPEWSNSTVIGADDSGIAFNRSSGWGYDPYVRSTSRRLWTPSNDDRSRFPSAVLPFAGSTL